MVREIAIVFSKSLFDSENIEFERKSDLSLSNSLLEDVKVTLYFSLEAIDNIINFRSDEGIIFLDNLPVWKNFIKDQHGIVPTEYLEQELKKDLLTSNLVLQSLAMEELASVVLYHSHLLSESEQKLLDSIKIELNKCSDVFIFKKVEILETEDIKDVMSNLAIKF